jgi:hypothetical protein
MQPEGLETAPSDPRRSPNADFWGSLFNRGRYEPPRGIHQ